MNPLYRTIFHISIDGLDDYHKINTYILVKMT